MEEKIIAVNKDEIRGLGKVSLCKFVIGTKKKKNHFFFIFPCSWMLHEDSLKKKV